MVGDSEDPDDWTTRRKEKYDYFRLWGVIVNWSE